MTGTRLGSYEILHQGTVIARHPLRRPAPGGAGAGALRGALAAAGERPTDRRAAPL